MNNTYNCRPPDWLIVGMNISMLGMIHQDIRLIRVEFDNDSKFLKIISYLSRIPMEDDCEDLEILINELDAMMGDKFDDADFECIHSKHSKRELNMMPGAVFRRKE